jgi:hypothetical protein
MKITIRHSKTDQEGAGQTIAIPFGKLPSRSGSLPPALARARSFAASTGTARWASASPIKACLTL